jgi:hypothetical protein
MLLNKELITWAQFRQLRIKQVYFRQLKSFNELDAIVTVAFIVPTKYITLKNGVDIAS